MRQEEDRLRANARRESQQRRLRERIAGRGLSAGFLEPDRDEDSDDESLSAIKKSFKPGGREFDRVRGVRDDSVAPDELEETGRRLETAKRLASDEDEDDDEEVGDEIQNELAQAEIVEE